MLLILNPNALLIFLPLALINSSLHAFCTGIVAIIHNILALVFLCARLRANNEWRARRLQFIEYAANEVVVNFGGADCRDGTASSACGLHLCMGAGSNTRCTLTQNCECVCHAAQRHKVRWRRASKVRDLKHQRLINNSAPRVIHFALKSDRRGRSRLVG